MKKYVLGIGVLLSFSFAAVAKNLPETQGGIDDPSVCDAVDGNLVLNCGFEAGTYPPPNWTVSGDQSFTGVDPTVAHSGAWGAYLGPVGGLGYFTQTLATTAGTTYTLTFWLRSGPPPNRFQVIWDGALVFDLVDSPTFDYTQVTVDNLVASVDGTDLAFGFYQPPDYWYLDDASVVAAPAK
jgi:hypothetical protein